MTSVLIVDDEVFIVDLYRDILQLRRYKVIATAFDGEEAVRKYNSAQSKPDVFVELAENLQMFDNSPGRTAYHGRGDQGYAS